MAAFRAGIRWADIPSESFSRSHTAPGSSALLQADNADQSYAVEDAVPEFENSQAGMNKYFATAAVLGDDSKPSESMNEDFSDSIKKMRSGKIADAGAGAVTPESLNIPDTCGSSVCMPGFKGLLVASPAEGGGGGCASNVQEEGRKLHVFSRRQQRGVCEVESAARMTPAKRNRRPSGAVGTTNNGTAGATGGFISSEGTATSESRTSPVKTSESKCENASTQTSSLATSQLPLNKRRKHGISSDTVASGASSGAGTLGICSAVSSASRQKRRSSGQNSRRRSGGGRRVSDGATAFTDSNLLLQMAAPSLLQLPGLVSPVFVPVGLPPGSATPALPGLLHPQVVEQQQRRASCAKATEEDEDEGWQRREAARMKDIAIGKATTGYRNFVRLVEKERRSDADPSTPDPKQRCSKAQFQRAYQKWRKQLHQYDTLDVEATAAHATSEATPTEEITSAAAVEADEPESKVATDQQEVDAILAFNKECEMAGL